MDRDRNTTGIYGDNRTAPYEMHRQNRPQLLSRMVFPASYTRNTQKEDLVLESVENFRTQYVSLCPGRAPLLLSPQNECNFRKFISTFIRPTLVKFGEQYDYDTCAKFIANYIQYEHLEDSEALPTRVVSPTTVMAWQVGNSIEISILLCSLLLGSGYNAFVVVGYAEKQVCDNDQTNREWHAKLPDERCSDDEAEARAPPVTEYSQYLRKRPVLVSQFDQETKDRERKQREDEMRIVTDEPPVDEAAAAAAAGAANDVNYVHAWVLIMPGRRNVDKPLFVEPSTGQTIPVRDADAMYVGVESVFNHHNYFVNLKPAAAVSTLNTDLRDLTTWEHIFLKDPEAAEEEDEKQRFMEDLTSDVGESGDTTLDLPASWVGPITLSRAQYENRYPGRTKEIRYANATVKLYAEYSEPDLRVQVVLLPDDHSVHHQVHTFYKHRQDKLRRRSVYPQEHSTNPRRIHDWFDAGRKKEAKVEGLRELIEPGVLRTMKFYWRAREDGLARRHEQFYGEGALKKVQEYYRGRDDDRLVYRSASFEQAKEQHGAGAAAGLQYAMTSSVGSKDHSRLEPFKMSEKFDRNPKSQADEDIQKRTFIKPQSNDVEIWVFYHYRDDCITRPSRLYPKNAEKE